jgi:dTDP-4-dehydrorhamnose reductase
MSHVPPSCPTCPVTAYGEFAAEAEKLFGALGSIASIVRFAKVMMPGAKRFISWIDDLSQGKMITAFSDLGMAPISLDDAIAALLAVADDPAGGICQVSGTTDINYYDAACYFASRLGVDSALVVEKCASDAGIPAEEIPRFSSLDTQRFTELTGRLAPEPHALIDYVFGEEFKLKGRRRHSAQSGN